MGKEIRIQDFFMFFFLPNLDKNFQKFLQTKRNLALLFLNMRIKTVPMLYLLTDHRRPYQMLVANLNQILGLDFFPVIRSQVFKKNFPFLWIQV